MDELDTVLEPSARDVVGSSADVKDIVMASIAISLRRIADRLDESDKRHSRIYDTLRDMHRALERISARV